ncbi:putative nucleotide-binding alpha-beta plait domain superfamily, RNA-binding domain superfamily [Helianthus debilis subsp. tardiflorus]
MVIKVPKEIFRSSTLQIFLWDAGLGTYRSSLKCLQRWLEFMSPGKKDKEGRTFGFVSFRNVADVKEIGRALNGTKMGGYKIIANLARFAMENVDLQEDVNKGRRKTAAAPTMQLRNNVIHSHAYVNKGKGKLFSELSSSDKPSSSDIPVADQGSLKSILVDNDSVAFKEFTGKALVGRCKDLKTLRCLNSLMGHLRNHGVSLSYLGGLNMFLKFVNEEDCVNFLLDHDCWELWFSSLDPWVGQSLSFERLAWIKIIGVPLHLASNNTFNHIAGLFGKIIHGSQVEAEDGNLSVSLVGVLVGEGGRIYEQVNLCWEKNSSGFGSKKKFVNGPRIV